MKVLLPYLTRDPDRHGNVRYYVQKGTRHDRRKVRLRVLPGEPGFMEAYETALASLHCPLKSEPRVQAHGTMRWLTTCYFESSEFLSLDSQSQTTRRRVIEGCLLEPVHSDRPEGATMAGVPVRIFDSSHVQALRDRKIKHGLPGAANNRRKYLSAMFRWAVENPAIKIVKTNPVREVSAIDYEGSGAQAWTDGDVEAFERRHPPGTKPNLALKLLLFTGVRRSDVVRLGRNNIGRDGHLHFVPWKKAQMHRTKKTKPLESVKPMIPELIEAIAATPASGTEAAFLVTAYGKPFTKEGFGNWWRDRCNEAGLPQCSAHGLRKLGATRAAEGGATGPELCAIYDWSSLKEAEPYLAAANRNRMTAKVIHLLAVKRAAE